MPWQTNFKEHLHLVLDLKKSSFFNFTKASNQLRLLHYPPQPEHQDERVIGAQARIRRCLIYDPSPGSEGWFGGGNTLRRMGGSDTVGGVLRCQYWGLLEKLDEWQFLIRQA